MSRDQRPGRIKMIDRSGEAAPARPIDDDPATAIVDPATLPAPDLPAAKPRTMLWSGVFLLACIAGATGVTLLPLPGVG